MGPADVPDGPLAVDTDAFSFIHLKTGRHREFADLVAGHPLALPFAVVGELTVLGIRSRWGQRRKSALAADIALCVVIPSDARVVDVRASMRARFMNRLKGEGINDLWVAACCLVHDLPLVTNNLSDFQTVAGEFSGLRLIHPDL